jgi:hypothetical protein
MLRTFVIFLAMKIFIGGWFIKDFKKTTQPLSRLLQKDVSFDFKEDCQITFDKIEDIVHFNADYTTTKLGYAF